MRTIKFYSMEDFLELPSPASEVLPKYYKEMPKYSDGSSTAKLGRDGNPNLNLKSCVPYLDAMLSGYVAVLWQDLQIEQSESGPYLQWRTKPDLAGGRPSNEYHGPVPAGHSEQPFVWFSPFLQKLPKGYSSLITHPFNRFDLPFTTLSGIVDSDFAMHSGKIPFFVKTDFEGIIEKGTPIYQILPIKREAWTREEDPSLKKTAEKTGFDSVSKIAGWYRDNVWNRKSYK